MKLRTRMWLVLCVLMGAMLLLDIGFSWRKINQDQRAEQEIDVKDSLNNPQFLGGLS